jgi:sugar O-acyltransferase (sialic acid O-acetyltransferase NeuD family)
MFRLVNPAPEGTTRSTDAGTMVLFGIGSPLAIEAEESCLRLGLEIVGVHNIAGELHVTEATRVVGLEAIDPRLLNTAFIAPLFTPRHRQFAMTQARALGFSLPARLVDPTAVVARSATLGAGTWINAGVVIGGLVRIGESVIVNRATSIGHHCVIEDWCAIGPGVTLAGLITVGRGTLIGAGAVIHPEVSIGANSVISAGTVLGKSVPKGSLVGGCPAQVIKQGLPGYRGGLRS